MKRQLLTRQETAKRLAVSLRTLDRLPLSRIRLGTQKIRFDEDEVNAYIEAHTLKVAS